MVKALPSESVTSWVKVYGRLGLLRSLACLHDWQMYVVDVVAEGRLGSWPGRRTGRSAEDIMEQRS